MTALAPLSSKVRPFIVKRGSSQLIQHLVSQDFNIDNGSGTTVDEILLHAVHPLTIIGAKLVYTTATDTAGAASANVKIGTTAGGVDIVASTALTAAKAIGGVQTLTIADGEVAAGENIFVRHTGVATTEVGSYRVVIEYFSD